MPNMKGRQWPFGYTFKLQKCANGNAYSTTSRSEDVLGGNGIKFIIHTSENGHNKPHLHAQYQQKEVVLEIPSGKVITGNINSKKMKLASEWVVTNEAFLKQKWNELAHGVYYFC